MGNKYSMVILIIVTGLLVIVLGIIFGKITHKFSIKNLEQHYETDSNLTVEIEEEKYEITIDSVKTIPLEVSKGEGLYKVQLLLSIDYVVILNNKLVLDECGYDTRIDESERGDKTIYYLYLEGEYPESKAKFLGDEIKEKFPTLGNYWLEKVEIEEELVQLDELEIEKISEELKEVEIEEIKPEMRIKETGKIGIEYELQLLANPDLSKVEEKKQILEELGYKAKITTTEKDGITFYRLRLEATFSLEEGKVIGEALKEQFDFIEGYWLDRVRK